MTDVQIFDALGNPRTMEWLAAKYGRVTVHTDLTYHGPRWALWALCEDADYPGHKPPARPTLVAETIQAAKRGRCPRAKTLDEDGQPIADIPSPASGPMRRPCRQTKPTGSPAASSATPTSTRRGLWDGTRRLLPPTPAGRRILDVGCPARRPQRLQSQASHADQGRRPHQPLAHECRVPLDPGTPEPLHRRRPTRADRPRAPDPQHGH